MSTRAMAEAIDKTVAAASPVDLPETRREIDCHPHRAPVPHIHEGRNDSRPLGREQRRAIDVLEGQAAGSAGPVGSPGKDCRNTENRCLSDSDKWASRDTDNRKSHPVVVQREMRLLMRGVAVVRNDSRGFGMLLASGRIGRYGRSWLKVHRARYLDHRDLAAC